MCFKQRYAYLRCEHDVDKTFSWIKYCDEAKQHHPYKPCEGLTGAPAQKVHVMGFCSNCSLRTKDFPKGQAAFQTKELIEYKKACMERRLEKSWAFKVGIYGVPSAEDLV